MKIIGMMILLLNASFAWSFNSNFYANKMLQIKYPEAFATLPAAISFHKELEQTTEKEKKLLVHELKRIPQLHRDIIMFETLSPERQVEVLRWIFSIECQVLKINPPELIIDETSIPGYAYFEFDPQAGGAGKVYLNKKRLKEEKNKSDFIILLLHETRHSAQFQLTQEHTHNALSKGFRASFKAQKELKEAQVKTSFCDFMLLLNEFEAFQFANYVHGALTDWQTSINRMGTLASQYNHNGLVRLDLLNVLTQDQTEPIELFNQLEAVQYEIMHK